MLTGSLLGLLPQFKHLPATVQKTAYPVASSTLQPLISTDHYDISYREDGYPASLQMKYESKRYNQQEEIILDNQDVEFLFVYKE